MNSSLADFLGESAAGLLEEVVVTGTRTEKLLSKSPVTIDVISGADIETISMGTLEQTLDFIPGVYLSRSQKQGYNILMRGFDGDRVLVLVDGQRLLSPTGSSVDFAQISALNIERIEVVRGAASALYGSAAMGGVINIITSNRPGNRFKASYKTGANADNENEELTAQTSVTASVDIQNWGFEIYHQVLDDPSFDPDRNDARELSADNEKSISQIKVNYRADEFDLRYKFQSFNENKNHVFGRFPGGGDNYYISDVKKDSHGFIVEFGVVEIKAQNIKHYETSGNRQCQRTADIEMSELDSQYTWGVDEDEWVAGIHYYADGLDQRNLCSGANEVDNKSVDGVEGFVQRDWIYKDDFEFVVGFRVQNDSGYGSHSAFRTNMKVDFDIGKVDTLTWRVSFGEGYRVPNIKERYFKFDHRNLGYEIQGDESLLPEESLSLSSDLEWAVEASSDVKITTGLGLHFTKGKNFLDAVFNPTKSANDDGDVDIYEYQNFKKTRIQGVDLDVSFKWKRQTLKVSYNYLDARDLASDQRLKNRPYHQIKTNLNYEISNADVNLLFYSVYQKGQAFDEGLIASNNEFTTINFTLAHTWSKNLSWKIGVENMLNVHREYDFNNGTEFDPRPDRGRYMFVNVELNIE